MYTETSLVMHGPTERIFALGAAIEDWPIILPHYRAVTLTERTTKPDGTIRKVATMKAWRPLAFGKIPVGWRTIQESDPRTGLLHFVHIGGFTKGMDVHWLMAPEGDATRVTITHDFMLRWPLIGGFVAHRIVGQFFVEAIARRTLDRIRAMVEDIPTPPAPLPRVPSGQKEGGEIGDTPSSASPPSPAGRRMPSAQGGVGMPRD